MKSIFVIVLSILILNSSLYGAELKKRPVAPTETWDFTDDNGEKYVIRKRPVAVTDTYDIKKVPITGIRLNDPWSRRGRKLLYGDEDGDLKN